MSNETHALAVGDAVQFKHRGKTIHGHLLQLPGRRRRAKVIDARDETWRVPGGALSASGRPRRDVMVTPQDQARANWRVGDPVYFKGRQGARLRGEIAGLNAKTAEVRCGETRWRVPYGGLQPAAERPARDGAARLNEVAALARSLMDQHELADWAFAFNESGRTLGQCRYQERAIRISRAHALEGKEDDLRDTILHEIAHALAGPQAGHGPRWQAAARRLGATPRARAGEEENPAGDAPAPDASRGDAASAPSSNAPAASSAEK